MLVCKIKTILIFYTFLDMIHSNCAIGLKSYVASFFDKRNEIDLSIKPVRFIRRGRIIMTMGIFNELLLELLLYN